jgi:hypothetical protein
LRSGSTLSAATDTKESSSRQGRGRNGPYAAQETMVVRQSAGVAAGIGELTHHAGIQSTMNIYGKAMTDSKRQAHSKVVEMVLNSSKSKEIAGQNNPAAAIGS